MADEFTFTPVGPTGEIEGTPIDFNAEPLTVTTYGGFGLLDPSVQQSPLAGQSGVSTLNATDNDRRMLVRVLLDAGTPAEAQTEMDRLSSKLALTHGSNTQSYGILTRTRDGGREFAIRCALQSGLEDNPDVSLEGSWKRELPLLFRAPHPYFHDPARQSISATTAITRGGLPGGPIRSPRIAQFPAGIASAELDLVYAGNADSQSLVWEVDGPARDPLLINRDNPFRERIQFAGTVPAGQTLIVQLGNSPRDLSRHSARVGEEVWTNVISRGPFPFILRATRNHLIHLHTVTDDQPATGVRLRWYREYVSC